MTSPYRARANEFLKIADQFHLGDLVTESPHPRTHDLSRLCQNDLESAAKTFHEIELAAISTLRQHVDAANDLANAMRETLHKQGRIFMVGCGATGRLALVLERIWREAPPPRHADSVIAFTAGGDYALVRSLGVFEDRADLGARHLLSLGFRAGDILVAITEGGETNFVLGALKQASKTSPTKSWLVFCNPPSILRKVAQRSVEAFDNPNVRSLALEIEPMALTGSTRLQASSVLMAFVGGALQNLTTGVRPQWIFDELIDRMRRLDPCSLVPLIKMESATLLRGAATLHRSQSAAIAVLTDTTERAPTFSLAPFENVTDGSLTTAANASRTYLEIPGTKSPRQAWQQLIGRNPRPFVPLDDPSAPNLSLDIIYGFDFSDGTAARREAYGVQTETVLDVEFENDMTGPTVVLGAKTAVNEDAEVAHVRWPTSTNRLIRQSLLKFALNLQSTLVMGRVGRYHGNLMTYVRPTNNKLIDRAIRTLRAFAAQSPEPHAVWVATKASDLQLLEALFEASDLVSADEPTVLRALSLLVDPARQRP